MRLFLFAAGLAIDNGLEGSGAVCIIICLAAHSAARLQR